MIPLSDIDRRPAVFPVVTAAIIGINVAAFLLELAAGEPFVNRWALVPAQVTAGHNLITILTSMFLHAGWMHIGSNMIFLWAFGPEVEQAMGRRRYLAFYLLGGLIAMTAQVAVVPNSNIPNLGASGAIAAVMGAFLITFPKDRIRTLIFIFFFVTITVIPAFILVGLWFLTELVSEVGALVDKQVGGVAYMAHVGGFIFGLIAARLFEARERVSPKTGTEPI